MPVYQVTDPSSGKKLRLTGDSPPTEAELEEIFAQYEPKQPQPTVPQQQPSIVDRAIGGLEAAGTVVSGAIAEPAAGVAGIVQTLNPFASEGAGARAVDFVREGMTYSPRTESGKESLETVAGIVEPVAQVLSGAEDYTGDTVYELTGSPALSAAAKTIPTAILEAIGLAGAKGVSRVRKASVDDAVNKQMSEATPTIEQLKNVSSAVYKEIDDMGAMVNPKSYESFVKTLISDLKKQGLDKDLTPDAMSALKRFTDNMGETVTLTEMDTLRKIARAAVKPTNPADSALGMMMMESIDDFLDNATDADIIAPSSKADDVGKRYKVARDLWGRARRSEVIQEAFEKARNQASGFENGLRTQFRSILNNKKQRKMFKKDELEAMRKVVRGDTKENIAKFIGKFGMYEGGATNALMSSLGAAGGAVAGGWLGSLAVIGTGQLSKNLAQRLTRNNAQFADQVIRAGKDAKKIVKAYNDNTPAQARSAEELSELLMRNDIDLDKANSNILSIEAARLAKQKRAELGSAAATGATAQSINQER